MKNKILCLIPARGGSKGIKNKNLVKLKGKPLLYWTLKIAKQIDFFDKIVVSTDSKKIQRYAEDNNVSAPFLRPKNISKDESCLSSFKILVIFNNPSSMIEVINIFLN